MVLDLFMYVYELYQLQYKMNGSRLRTYVDVPCHIIDIHVSAKYNVHKLSSNTE